MEAPGGAASCLQKYVERKQGLTCDNWNADRQLHGEISCPEFAKIMDRALEFQRSS